MDDPLRRLAEFADELHRAGVAVGSGSTIDFCRAAALLAPEELYWAGRVTLVSRPGDLEIYDRVFREAFGAEPDARERPREPVPAVAEGHAEPDPGGELDEDADEATRALASTHELVRRKDFAEWTDDELRELSRAGRELLVITRRARRHRPAKSGTPDLRRTLRHAMRAGGEPWDRRWRRRREEARTVVLLLDVSGSMASYSRALLALGHAGVRDGGRWEIFCFATRLTRVTRTLGSGTLGDVLTRAAGEVVDWDGGTRIGESLKTLIDEHGHGSMLRGAVVVVCSDGLERGDPELLAGEMERLSRLAHHIVWLNPLKADPAFEPLTRGMLAALPFVDQFVSGHNLESIEAIAGTAGRGSARTRAASPATPPSRELEASS